MNQAIPTKKRSLAEIIAERKAQQAALEQEANISTAGEMRSQTATSNETPQAAQPAERKLSLKEILAAKRGQPALIASSIAIPIEAAKPVSDPAGGVESLAETFSLNIHLNEKQLLAKELAFSGKSFCLIGAAGTGKTTAQREIAAELIRQNKLGIHSFKIQGSNGMRCDAPSIGFVAYTRIAAGNLKRAIHKDPALEEILLHNITTIHNLLEYEPETYWDYVDNCEKFRFVPRRTAGNPLDLTHLIIEESSMVGLDLWEKLYAALRPDTQIIFIGDINQLPPVFGASILNYALIQLPIVELTHVYRQKEGSSILDNAHKILAGSDALVEDPHFKIIRGGDIQYTQSKMSLALSTSLKKWKAVGEYDPEQDIILSPFNKQDLGTDMLNTYISQFLGEERGAVVHEIVAGINKLYLAVGDKVLFNKQVGYVKEIKRNGQYLGKQPKTASHNLTRHGTYNGTIDDSSDDGFDLAGYENISLEEIAAQAEESEAKRKASHIVELEMETGITETLETTGSFAPASFSLGYALTVHKAQGCEWRKVFLVLHKDHSIMAFRELLYTAVTRARESLNIIAKDFMISKAIKTQRIKGNTLAEKVAYFNAGLMSQENVSCVK